MVDEPEELLTADEAAARLGVTRSYLYRLIKRGVLPEAVGIRNGREVKLIPASALARLDAHEGLLVRDVGEAEQRPVTDAPEPRPVADDRSTTGHSPDPGGYLLLLTEMRSELRSLRDQLEQERAARKELEAELTTRHAAPETDVAAALSRANEVTALVKASEIKQNRILEEERAARKALAAELDRRDEPSGGDVAAALSRANEVTALVKASEIKQNRILEELLSQRKWGRAKQFAYAAYLVLTTLASLAAVILVYQLAAHLRALFDK